MSSSQALRISQQDFAILAPSWQVGISGSQSLTKSLKNIDVESVNIGKTCDKLGLALNENLKYLRGNLQNIDDSGQQCAIEKSNVSFRNFSNIWFGTLKIYQQQVDKLFRLSQDLLSRSSNYDEKRVEGRKRHARSTSYKLIKKRRLTLSEPCKESYLATNYSKLLDDLEKLAREPTPLPLPEDTQIITGSITQYQIREITLREISAKTFIQAEELDEDSGFGEATHQEIAEFFNFVEAEDILNAKSTTSKRKTTCVEEAPIKKSCLINDHFAEPRNDENVPFDENVLKALSTKRSTFSHCLHEDTKSDIIHNNGIFEAVKIKKENIADIENTSIHCEKNNKRRKLIIDDCIKLDMSDVVIAMKTSEICTKHSRKRTLKAFKTKRNMLALDLLTRFNRRSLRLSLSLKMKFVLSREQFKRDYLNLLREIFKNNYKEEWASEIYPRWIFFGNGQLKPSKRQQRLNKSKNHKMIVIQPEDDVCNLYNVQNTNVWYKDKSEEIATLDINNNKECLLNTNIYDEWRPYGVMLKLLNLWRSNQTNKIAAYKLFKLAKNQVGRGLGFNSLLQNHMISNYTTQGPNRCIRDRFGPSFRVFENHFFYLSKKRFVNLTKYPDSIELQNIEVGNKI